MSNEKCPYCSGELIKDSFYEIYTCNTCCFQFETEPLKRIQEAMSREPLSEEQQKWLELAPEFEPEKYDYMFRFVTKENDEYWNAFEKHWKKVTPFQKAEPLALIRRPKAPKWEVGDLCKEIGTDCRGEIQHIKGDMAWVRWNAGPTHSVIYLDQLEAIKERENEL